MQPRSSLEALVFACSYIQLILVTSSTKPTSPAMSITFEDAEDV